MTHVPLLPVEVLQVVLVKWMNRFLQPHDPLQPPTHKAKVETQDDCLAVTMRIESHGYGG